MTAILFADLSGPAERAFSDAMAMQGGRLLRQNGGGYLAGFDSVPHAISCALALQSELAARNRERHGARPLSARLAVDRVEVAKDGECPSSAIERVRAIGAAASVGRVMISRAAYLHARTAQLFAFIAIGAPCAAGAIDAIEVFEAIATNGKEWTAGSGKPSSAATSPVRERAASPSARIIPDSVAAWILVAAVGAAVFGLHRPISAMLMPFEILRFVFYQAGVALFGAGDGSLAAAIGGLLVPVVMPALALIHYARANRAIPARVALVWLGQSIIGLGEPLLRAVPSESFAEATGAAILQVLYASGAIASAHLVASVLVGVGSFVMAIAAVPGVIALFRGRQN